jgi:hypothetical protein
MSVHDLAASIVGGAATVNADNPWPGLLAFRETDQSYFQGRQAETEELLRLVLRERLTVLFGLSGLGKSSLLQAGLFPRLRQENILPVYIRLDYSSERLDLPSQVIEVTTNEAYTSETEAPRPRNGESLWEYFHREANVFWNARNRPVQPLLVFDQFEETLTLGRLNQNRSVATATFLRQLADLAECRPPAELKARIDEHPAESGAFNFGRHHYKVLLSIREDFLPDLESLRASMPTLALNRMRIQRMNGEAALLVVNQAQHLIDPEVGEQVVRFVAADKASLPLASLEIEPALLSVVCRELNNRRQTRGESKISADLLKGNQDQVLADFYERSTADLAPELKSFVEHKLLTVSGYRDIVALDNALSTYRVSRTDIETLVERRLVRMEDRGGMQRLELTHDLLASVVRSSRDNRHQREKAAREHADLLKAKSKLQLFRRLAIAFAVLALICAIGWFAVSFFRYRALRNDINESTSDVRAIRLAAGQAPSINDLAKLDRLRQQLVRIGEVNSEGFPFSLRLFPRQYYRKAASDARQVYFESFKQMLFQDTQSAILADLQGLPERPSASDVYDRPYYELKAYLITTVPQNFNRSTRDFPSSILTDRWAEIKRADDEQKELARRQFEYYTRELLSGWPQLAEEDLATVQYARTYLSNVADSERYYRAILANISDIVPPISFSRMFPSATGIVSSKPVVPGAFTDKGYKMVHDAVNNPQSLLLREEWVVGKSAPTQSELTLVQEHLLKRYYRDFIEEWLNVLRNTSVLEYRDLRDALLKLDLMSGPESPILQFLWFVSDNTDLEGVRDAFTSVQNLEPPKAAHLIQPAIAPYMQALGDLRTSIDVLGSNPTGLNDQAAVAVAVTAAARAKQAAMEVAGSNSNNAYHDDYHTELLLMNFLRDPATKAQILLTKGGQVHPESPATH